MDRERMLKRLLVTFLDELNENVAALNGNLLVLEKSDCPSDQAECLKALFRTAHSLKGAARSASVLPIEQACHSLESILARVQSGQLPASGVFALLFATADALEEAGMRLREQQDLGGSPLVELLPRLEEAARTPTEGESTVAPAMSVIVFPPVQRELAPEPMPSPALAPKRSLSSPALEDVASVRVPAEKLDAFLGRSGALMVARRRVLARVEDLTSLREDVGRWKKEWHDASRPLPALLRAEDSSAGRRWPQRLVQAMAEVGENVERLEERLERLGEALAADVRALKESGNALDDEVRRVRMLPFAEACAGLERLVHDLSGAGGKQVDLVIEGGQVELDRSVLEGLRDPLRHLVRNAIDHGAETPDERRAAGKPVTVRLTVSAVLRGAQVEVAVSDDGRGIDLDGLRLQLRKRGLPEPADERELARAVFLPGLSTTRLITDVSGRGVGLDVVKSRVEALHGTIDLSFVPGRGTRFSLAAPLTLTTLRALLVKANAQTFAFVDTTVERLVRIKAGDLRCIEGREMLALGGPPMPVVSLADTLGLRGGTSRDLEGKLPVVVVKTVQGKMAFVVDELLAEQEVVVKGLGVRIRRLRHVSGASLLPSGEMAMVLNVANLVRTALSRAPASGVAPVASSAKNRHRLLVVDDSVTTRTLEKSILEAAGYDVTVAADGVAAWQLLQERAFDLVVSDVDMPRMDGFGLTEAVRGSRQYPDLPVVLVTARASETDQARGLEVGANAYLLKSSFDQTNLLQTIAQLL